ncbi:MAG TPA: GGDEF domain-containing protein [Solirubrobacterales bacterium]|nr:GGDEF domain-containing protein [Solirubrobacterales bacterium]
MKAAIGAVLFGGTVVLVAHDWLGLGGSSFDAAVNGPLYDAVVIAAGLACVLKGRASGRERGAWYAIAAAIFSWAAGEIYWTAAIENDPTPPNPSPADIGYLAFYPLAILGVAQLVRARARELDWRLWMDGLIAALGTAALGASLVFEYVSDRTTGSALEVATTLAYPLADIFTLALLVGVVALTRWRPGRTWTLLVLGLAVLAVADIGYTLQSSGGLPEGSWIEPLYLLGAVIIGTEAWQPRAETIQPVARFDGWRELMIPGFFAVLTLALFAIQYASAANALTGILTAGTMLAVIARLAISVRENKRLLEEVQTDQLTGLGNQGRLQVDLAERCARAAEQPLTLLLLDLNGFKRYNDTFGHPAGDAMLTTLGRQLREAVRGSGFAYRIGGDEFAVLIGGEESSHDTTAKRAAEALTASGSGYEVSAAWGTVAIPREATAAMEAMQLADVRMYAQKESRRAATEAKLVDAPMAIRLRRVDDSKAL